VGTVEFRGNFYYLMEEDKGSGARILNIFVGHLVLRTGKLMHHLQARCRPCLIVVSVNWPILMLGEMWSIRYCASPMGKWFIRVFEPAPHLRVTHAIYIKPKRNYSVFPIPKHTQSSASTKLLIAIKVYQSLQIWTLYFQKFSMGKAPRPSYWWGF